MNKQQIYFKGVSGGVVHCARVLLLFSYGKFTTNSNKNIHIGVYCICTLENQKVTHLLKGFPRYQTDYKTNLINYLAPLLGPTGRHKMAANTNVSKYSHFVHFIL